jgi:hypothetical protein
MATNNTITAEIKLKNSDGSIKNETKNLENLNAAAEKLDNSTKRRTAAAGRAVDMDYGTSRGVIGTGAGGRDFAKESQGLGGLVRLYATYAANLFAASAAYTALSNAANTANMVQGLDQLGAQSGRPLGTLAKNLVAVTDNAISLKDAMTATAQATAAGMSSANLLRLGTVAKQASQALGIGMTDAVSRLSRGITKLEPELLDELGLFTKIEQSNNDYARSLGKTAGSLTDFEKRQGFANSVLKEAEEKFGKLKIDANPYDKLSASMSNLSFKALDLINKGLLPIVDLLAKSPLALTGVLLGIGSIIIKQAIPAIGLYKEALRSAADASLLAVAGKSTDAAKALANKKAQVAKEAEAIADTYVNARDLATDKLEALKTSRFGQEKKKVSAILNKGIYDIDAKDIAYLEQQGKKNVGTNKALADSYQEVADVIKSGKQAESDAQRTRNEAALAQQKLEEKGISNKKEDEAFRKQGTAAALADIRAAAAGRAQEQGFIQSLKAGWKDLKAAKDGYSKQIVIPGEFEKKGKKFVLDEAGEKIPKTTTVVTAGIGKMGMAMGTLDVLAGATGGTLSKLASKLGIVGIAIGAAVAVFEVFSAVFGKAGKEFDAFALASDNVTAAVDNVGKTLDAISKKSPDKILSVESVQARANAFLSVSDSIQEANKKFEEFNKKKGWFENSTEWTQRVLSTITLGFSEKLIGGGAKKKMAENIAESAIAAIKIADSGKDRDRITAELSKLLGFDASSLDSKALTEALDQLDFGDLQTKGTGATSIIKRFSDQANNSASDLTAFNQALDQSAKDIDALSASLAPGDPLGKIGSGLIAQAAKLDKVLADPKHAIEALMKVVSSSQELSILPPDTAKNLIGAKQEIMLLADTLGNARSKALQAREELVKLKKDKAEPELIQRQQSAIKSADFVLERIEEKAKAAAAKYSEELAVGIFQSGVKYLEASLKFAMQEGAIAAAKGYLSVLAMGGGATAQSEGALKDKELALQASMLDAQFQAKIAQERNTIALDRNTLSRDVELQTSKLNAALTAKDEQGKIDALEKLSKLTRSQIINEEKSKQLEKPTIKQARDINASKNIPGEENFAKIAAGELASVYSSLYGLEAGKAKIAGQRTANTEETKAKTTLETAKKQRENLDIDVKRNEEASKLAAEQQGMLLFYDAEIGKKKLTADQDALSLKFVQDQIASQGQLDVLNQLKGKFVKDSVDEQNRLNEVTRVETVMRDRVTNLLQGQNTLLNKNKDDEIAGIAAIAKFKADIALRNKVSEKDIKDSQLSQRDTELNYLVQTNAITEENAAKERASIDRARQKATYDEQVLQNKIAASALDEKQAKLDKAKSGGVDTTKDQKLLDEEVASYVKQKEAIDKSNDAKLYAIDATEKLGSHMVGLEKITSNAFLSMADALVTFAQTGKLNFKDLINSMLADLLRFELRQQLMGAYAGMGSGGLLGGLAKMLGMSAGSTGGLPVLDSTATMAGMPTFAAKGRAYDMGMQRFATGGMFTNSVVNEPTLFKFAHGTGMMGEAGPEAIMPLKRDGNGSLGVVNHGGGSGKVDVVVNNFSTEKATTKETVDSKGNRKIEVMVGDMVADQLGRHGSSAQQALTSNYGQRPVLVRR